MTHYALEDVALMRAQPELTVLVPADAARLARRFAPRERLDGPVYLRLEKGGPPVPGLDGRSSSGARR